MVGKVIKDGVEIRGKREDLYTTIWGEFSISGLDNGLKHEINNEVLRRERAASACALENLVNRFDPLGIYWTRKYQTLTPVEQMFEQTFRFWCDIIGDEDFGLIEQAEIESHGNKYIVDFLFDASSEWNENLCKDASIKVAIEIDGHDYHHTSKKQVAHDYERENNLKLDGYEILRFTGSQIYNEPFKCGKIAYDFIKKLSKKPRRRKR